MKIGKKMIYLFIVLHLLFCGTPNTEDIDEFKPDNDIESLSLEELELFIIINEYRVDNGLELLEADRIFNYVARDRTTYMIHYNDISHLGFPIAIEPLLSMGFVAGENIAYGYTTNESLSLTGGPSIDWLSRKYRPP